MNLLTRQSLFLRGCLVLFLVFLLFSDRSNTQLSAQPYDLPVRVIARADVHRLKYNEYSVRECLDIYNDDNRIPLIINAVTADTWRGHQKHVMGENWFENRAPLTIKPNSVYRVIERKRVVSGKMKRDWWVRWIKFKIGTSRGEFESNFVASPFKRPGVLVNEQMQPQIDTLSEPQALTPAQRKFKAND